MLTKIARLKKSGGFRLHVRFTDGNEGIHDFSAMIADDGPMLESLRDEAYFNRVFLEFGALGLPRRRGGGVFGGGGAVSLKLKSPRSVPRARAANQSLASTSVVEAIWPVR